MEKPKIGEKVYITKYALTKGVQVETVLDDVDMIPTMIVCAGATLDGHTKRIYFQSPDWHSTEAQANLRVLAVIEEKVESLIKQTQKLQYLKDEYWEKVAVQNLVHQSVDLLTAGEGE